MHKSSNIKSLILFLLGIICTSPPSFAQNNDIKLATFEYPPLFHSTKNGKFSGTIGETVAYMCEQSQITCHIEALPYKRAYQKLFNNQVDGLITIDVNTFQDCCLSSDWHTPWIAGFFSEKPLDEIPSAPDQVLGKTLISVAGMKSPYEFMPDLTQWAKDKKVGLFSANNIFTATRMFINNRADLLWGSEEFTWYFEKQHAQNRFNFRPLLSYATVIWVRKDRPDILTKLNAGYALMQKNGALNEKNILTDDLMKTRYVDAPFNYE